MDNRESFIWQKLNEHYKEALSLGYEVFAIIVQGSQNYGLDLYTKNYMSDIDTKCIVLPSFQDFVLGSSPVSHTHERENKEHIDLKDIRIMFDTFRKQNVNFVEVLFSDYYIVPDKYVKYWEELISIAENIVHAHPSQTVKTMSGMSKEKYKALEHRYPSIEWKIDKWGYDGKQLHHIIRINDFIKRYISGMSFKDAMTPTDDVRYMLFKAKLNEYTLDEARLIAKEYDEETNSIKDKFILDNGDKIVDDSSYNIMNNIKYKVLKDHFSREILKD